MDTKYTISTTEARKNFAEIIDSVQETGARYTLTTNGKPRAVLLDAEEFESIMETLDVMSDPELVAAIKEGEKNIREGNVFTLEELIADGTIV